MTTVRAEKKLHPTCDGLAGRDCVGLAYGTSVYSGKSLCRSCLQTEDKRATEVRRRERELGYGRKYRQRKNNHSDQGTDGDG